jgi:hypothetical protein
LDRARLLYFACLDIEDLVCTLDVPLCQTDTSIKGQITTGLTKHLGHKHREQYKSMNDNKADGSNTSVASSIFLLARIRAAPGMSIF